MRRFVLPIPLIPFAEPLPQIAQAGGDTADLEDKLAEEQKKLDTNIATDKKSAGATSQSVV